MQELYENFTENIHENDINFFTENIHENARIPMIFRGYAIGIS